MNIEVRSRAGLDQPQSNLVRQRKIYDCQRKSDVQRSTLNIWGYNEDEDIIVENG